MKYLITLLVFVFVLLVSFVPAQKPSTPGSNPGGTVFVPQGSESSPTWLPYLGAIFGAWSVFWSFAPAPTPNTFYSALFHVAQYVSLSPGRSYGVVKSQQSPPSTNKTSTSGPGWR